tara:strand:- start:47 stop:232 length:186 start_codon:yes stop_codon:yes gene_type:complete
MSNECEHKFVITEITKKKREHSHSVYLEKNYIFHCEKCLKERVNKKSTEINYRENYPEWWD